jgi:hypothetical protein
MNVLVPNTATQTLRLTLDEGRTYFETAFTDYLLIIKREENSDSGTTLAQVPVVVIDNTRITQLTVTTVGLTTPGLYAYYVYGQNSDSNLDPDDSSVVGLVEKGTITLSDSTQYFNAPAITFTPDYR